MTGGLADLDVAVLAGGLGTRLRGVLGDELPKVLAPVGDRPFLDLLIAWLEGFGARRVVLCLGYRAEKVHQHLAARPAPAHMVVDSVVEPQPLGTGGALRFAAGKLTSDPVLVMNGDSWIDSDLSAFVESFKARGAYLGILCAQVDDASRYGRLEVDGAGWVTSFAEKEATPRPGLINAGLYLLSAQAMADLNGSDVTSFERDFLQKQPPGRIYAHLAPGADFIDIGTPESLSKAPDIIATEIRTSS